MVAMEYLYVSYGNGVASFGWSEASQATTAAITKRIHFYGFFVLDNVQCSWQRFSACLFDGLCYHMIFHILVPFYMFSPFANAFLLDDMFGWSEASQATTAAITKRIHFFGFLMLHNVCIVVGKDSLLVLFDGLHYHVNKAGA
ncbi:hypothetical protein M5K25_002721 [Dendrobium thyrsiflorum]|uniref:Uncharacterized protein n=1 Tax=Dendrobium thyrsiflorum TaxID=117978 RepID=A0ABD0VUM0_DENTH